jgi:hypothetical protein
VRGFWVLPVLLSGSPAQAYRPFDSTDADVVDRGTVEVELGPMGYLDDGSEQLVAPDLVVTAGLHPRVEIVLQGRGLVALDHDADERRYRLEDTALLAKGLLRAGCLQGGQGPSAALEVGMLLPTLHGESGVGAEGIGIVSQRWSRLTAHLNGTVSRTRAETWELAAGLIIEGPRRFGVRPVAEATLSREIDEKSAASGLVGLIWEARDDLAFDLAFRYADDDGRDVRELRAGFTWSLPGLLGGGP